MQQSAKIGEKEAILRAEEYFYWKSSECLIINSLICSSYMQQSHNVPIPGINLVKHFQFKGIFLTSQSEFTELLLFMLLCAYMYSQTYIDLYHSQTSDHSKNQPPLEYTTWRIKAEVLTAPVLWSPGYKHGDASGRVVIRGFQPNAQSENHGRGPG